MSKDLEALIEGKTPKDYIIRCPKCWYENKENHTWEDGGKYKCLSCEHLFIPNQMIFYDFGE